MRVLLLMTLLITACFSPNEAIISQSTAVTEQDLTDKKSPAYIKEGECLIDIKGELKLNETTILSPLRSCLPSSQLSWLFEAKAEQETIPAQQRLKLAVLLDTSSSLRANDPNGARYRALRAYLLALHNKITGQKNIQADAHITSAEIQIYPFKYCDRRKNKEHKLEINKNTTGFSAKIEALIGDNYTHKGSADDIDTDTGFSKLTEYGAYGSTNYLHSLSKAIEFFKEGNNDNDLKQVLIFSDGLPFTFNDSVNTTIDLSVSGCNIDRRGTSAELRRAVLSGQQFNTGDVKTCVTEEFYPKDDKCTRPTKNDKGQTLPETAESWAWSDPLNHVLGMVQHSNVIQKAKASHNFEVYAVLLKPSSCNGVIDNQDKIICKEITTHLAQPFFESFTEDYQETSDVNKLAESLRATLDAQMRTIEYKQQGTAFIGDSQVDAQTKLHTGNLIKVGRDGENDSVYDYRDHEQDILTVAHGLEGNNGGKFSIEYNFEFPAATAQDEASCRSSEKSLSGDLEVNKYSGKGYTAWCLLTPRCDENDHCCDDNHREITADQGKKLCASQGEKRQWIGFKGNNKVCACVCDRASEEACVGAGQRWDATTCNCTRSIGGDKVEVCVPSNIICCKNGAAHDVLTCAGKGGGTWNSAECRCVPETSASPPESSCESSRECCDSTTGAAMTPKRCSAGQEWKGHPTCDCRTKTNPPITVTPPTGPTTPPDKGGGKNEPENPQKAGKEVEDGGPPAAPAVTEGIIWGDLESF